MISREHTGEEFVTKDSGERLKFESGMQRDVETGKKDYSLCLSGPMFERWAALLTRGAIKYERNNWMKARGNAEEERFIRSAFRHFVQWMNGEKDEDHGAAVFFNINGAEYVRSLRSKDSEVNTVPEDCKFSGPLGPQDVNTTPFVDRFKGHTGPHPPVAELQDPSVCTYCRPEPEEEFEFPCTCEPGKEFHEVVDKTMAQDGTSPTPYVASFKERVANGVRHVFYHGLSGRYYVHVYEFETGKKLCESVFTYLFDAEEDYNKDWKLDID